MRIIITKIRAGLLTVIEGRLCSHNCRIENPSTQTCRIKNPLLSKPGLQIRTNGGCPLISPVSHYLNSKLSVETRERLKDLELLVKSGAGGIPIETIE